MLKGELPGMFAVQGQHLTINIDCVYLDHAGSTLSSKSLMDCFAAEMTSMLYGNPHSASSPSQQTAMRIDDIRLALLSFFKADPSEYDLVFVPNATAGVKLVVEAMRALPSGYIYAYHQACHTSVIGAREDSQFSTCLDDRGVQSWLDGTDPFHVVSHMSSARLFSYSAQSHMDGRRNPISWAGRLKRVTADQGERLFTLLDAASLGATSQLDLSSPDFAADFTVLSLYKIFGFPDLGVLLVRRSAETVFDNKRYFGGGTVDMVTCGTERWHVRKSQFLHERLEDGTLPFHSIIAVAAALKAHERLFGSMHRISAHTSYLATRLRQGLRDLRHRNGLRVCTLYLSEPHQAASDETGPIVSFNIRNSCGDWVSLVEFEKLAILKKMHIRTGSLCCPGGIASALQLEPWELMKNLSAGYRCGTESDTLTGKPHGVIRASLGAMSTASDVDRFVQFVQDFFVENTIAAKSSTPRLAINTAAGHLRVKTMTIFPIKSCGGFFIPAGNSWEVRAEGLAWDREWCLVHRGSGQALSQKRYPRMALLRPFLDLERRILRVSLDETGREVALPYVDIPLETDPELFCAESRRIPARVCGEQVHALKYVSEQINDFFSSTLGVPCILARFPPGGRGLDSRTSKARLQKHQRTGWLPSIPGSFPWMPSPPDSDSEQQNPSKILLSNESPILLVHSASVKVLNREIQERGGDAVSESTFRANIVVESLSEEGEDQAYAEDSWSELRIGSVDFKLLGACRRCQMVCVDQDTAERREEPLSTLAKTRRFDGKVYFGAHMRHEKRDGGGATSSLPPMIEVGDVVTVYGGATPGEQ
ncbi:Molybdenum cofactor sulfurase [Hirsutella minnesotensis 3608]|uniref:Molybdenum cofactor sulfurase n=1 Tax=Hirsutella minnesotensis 3608 TaxID=1043627 RepID=A0A0F7ZMV2_9HYPO|nr:Molybdenum cofactor sulfurase [Hirsutella minnesotensis 3608]